MEEKSLIKWEKVGGEELNPVGKLVIAITLLLTNKNFFIM